MRYRYCKTPREINREQNRRLDREVWHAPHLPNTPKGRHLLRMWEIAVLGEACKARQRYFIALWHARRRISDGVA